ncbi:MAG: hypothetical protein AAFY76_17610 [Cyanobacteria bacterium J06649_11]
MEGILENLLADFITQAKSEGIRLGVRSMYEYVQNTLQSSKNTYSQLYHAGRMYYMNDNSLLYYSDEENTVYGYDFNQFGDRWVETNISILENPGKYGGYFRVQKYLTDINGNLFYE